MGERRDADSVSGIAGFALGISYALAFSSLKVIYRNYPASRAGGMKSWLGYLIAGVIVVLPLVPRLRRIPYVMLPVAGFVPIVVSSTLAQRHGFNSVTGYKIRSVGTLVAFVFEFLAALYFLRQKKELDRQIFTQSGLVAFFATIAVGVVYGVAEDAFRAPHLALTWLSLFGLTVFVVSLFVVEKRYS